MKHQEDIIAMTGDRLLLFVCLHGSAKSLVAMEHFNRFAAERQMPMRALSAGTEPDDEVPPEVVAGLARDGFAVAGRKPLRATPSCSARRGGWSRSAPTSAVSCRQTRRRALGRHAGGQRRLRDCARRDRRARHDAGSDTLRRPQVTQGGR